MEEDSRGPRRNFGGRGRREGGRGGGGRGGRGFRPRRDFGPKEKHKATCSECGKECEVPFEPEEGRDVFCTECFKKKRGY